MGHRGRLLALFLFVLVLSAVSTYLVIVQPGRVPGTADEIPRITKEQLLRKIERNDTILVVDTRAESIFNSGHIRGAVSVPFAMISQGEWVPPSDIEVVFY